ncbi:MAG TPA: hypothetical protein VF647_22935 [Longimicrobium sp.]
MILSDRIRGAARRKAGRLAVVLALFACALPADAQVIAGRVTRAGTPEPGLVVELHRVTRNTRGPVGKVTSGPGGAFSIPLPPVQDSAGFTVFFATAIANGVRYFGPVVHGGAGDRNYEIQVYDTTSSPAAADSVRVTRRDVVLISGSEGGWEVAELVRVENRARRTLVPDATRPLFGIAIPKGSTAFEAGDGAPGEASPGAGGQQLPGDVVRVGDRVWINAPLVPGERDVIFRYRLAPSPREASIPVEHATDSLNLYVKQPAPEVLVAGLAAPRPFTADGEQFLQFSGAGLRAGSAVGLDWRGPAPAPVDPRWAALAAAGAVLAVGAWLAVRRGREA